VNYLIGTIPSDVIKLQSLWLLHVQYNAFTGTIPDRIGELYNLTSLSLESNNFTGSIPSSISNLIQLKKLAVGTNQLLGSIPEWIGNLKCLYILYLDDNFFTGTIPSSMTTLSNLTYLYLEYNYLNGTIPNEIGNLTTLKNMFLDTNYLSGTIPIGICNLTSLLEFSIYNNIFQGSIPSCVEDLTMVKIFLLYRNFLSGSIPSSLQALTSIIRIDLSNNLMTGSIPDFFYSLNHLASFEIENNLLTGSLPSSISSLALLNELFVQNNDLSGDLNNVFNGSHQKMLTNVQLSSNQFTGELPKQLFYSTSLVSVSAVSNCFHGTIPSSICLNEKLETLALDGLVCASSCQTKILPGISSSYISTRKISGSIPNCLWLLSKLQVLHLSGNSLTGSLPSDNAILSRSLQDLSLSYNHLTGTISSKIQTMSLPKLDLSNNLFTGILHSKNTSTSQNKLLSLRNNRFSGSIPNMFLNMINIDILEGNLFTCNNDNSNLPSHDHYASIYECGSNIFNILYFIWLGLLMAIIIAGLWVWYVREDLILLFHQWITTPLSLSTVDNIEINESLKEKLISMVFLKRYLKTLEIIRNVSLYSIVFIIIVLLPTYTVLSAFYRTHTYAYAWTVALMYLSGKLAFGISMGALIMCIAIQMLAVINSFTTSPNQIIFDDYILTNNREQKTNQ
jgi:Leucine-rich repeat (LRR) protein